jgi:hypothetical protein
VNPDPAIDTTVPPTVGPPAGVKAVMVGAVVFGAGAASELGNEAVLKAHAVKAVTTSHETS